MTPLAMEPPANGAVKKPRRASGGPKEKPMFSLSNAKPLFKLDSAKPLVKPQQQATPAAASAATKALVDKALMAHAACSPWLMQPPEPLTLA